jgi:hypothetical protein
MQHAERTYLCLLIAVCLVINAVSHSIDSLQASSNDNVDVRHGAFALDSFGKLSSPKLSILSLVDLSLDSWGSKIAVRPKIGFSKVSNFTDYQAVALKALNITGEYQKEFLSEKPTNLVRFASSARESSHRFFTVFAACVIVLLCLAGVMYLCENEQDDLEYYEHKAHGSPFPQTRDVDFQSAVQFDGSNTRNVGTQIGETDASTVPRSEPDGSWVRAYREATGHRKAALELLFKCQIISNQEFLYSRVSQEHIDECVWVGNFMLQEKSLEEWQVLWQQAQQTFEDSVTQCFSARTDARSFAPLTSPVPASGVPTLDCNSARDNQFLADDPYTTRTSLRSEEGFTSPLPVNTPASPETEARGRGEKPLGEFPERGLSPIISRCRAIISAPPQEGVPVENPTVVRSSSVATTITAMPASRQSSVAHISPLAPSRDDEQSQSWALPPRDPAPGEIAPDREQAVIRTLPPRDPAPVDVSRERFPPQSLTLPEPVNPTRPDSRTFLQAERAPVRSGTPPVLLFPAGGSAQTAPLGGRPLVQQQQGGARIRGETSPTATTVPLLPSLQQHGSLNRTL